MEEEISIDGNNELPITHFFVYKGKQYPFNMNIFKCFSQYFNSNEDQYEQNTNIDLVDESDENENIPESTITDFINFCQKNSITLNKSNVLSLHRLAKKYMVTSLIKATNKYISFHQKEIVIDLLLLNQNDNDDANDQKYEEILSEILPDYFQDDRLLSLPLPSLHRIVTKYTQKNKNTEKRSEFIEFLFGCLDKFGRKCSMLFEHVDIGGYGGTFIHRLLKDYSEIFDFHFVNDQQLKTIYDIESEIIGKTQKLAETETITKTEIDALKQKLSELKTENDELRTAFDEANRERNVMIHQMMQKQEELLNANEELKRKLDESIRNRETQIQRIETSLAQMLSQLNEKLAMLDEKVTQQNGLIEKINEQLVAKNRPINCHFLGDSNPTGIVARLSSVVTLSAGGFPRKDHQIENIMKYDNSLFCNYNNGTPTSESHSYIKFDFGPSIRIDLYSYFIRSNQQSAATTAQHPKTWRIEGSNDDSHWTRLDRRENDSNLYGPYKQHHFLCKESLHGDESSRYRYIRYVQENSWWNGYPYYVYITYFELYGDIFGN